MTEMTQNEMTQNVKNLIAAVDHAILTRDQALAKDYLTAEERQELIRAFYGDKGE